MSGTQVESATSIVVCVYLQLVCFADVCSGVIADWVPAHDMRARTQHEAKRSKKLGRGNGKFGQQRFMGDPN